MDPWNCLLESLFMGKLDEQIPKVFTVNSGSVWLKTDQTFVFFLNKSKCVAKAYHLEIIQLGEGILTHRYKRILGKRIDCFISETERKLDEKRYTSMEYLKVVAHVT